MFGGNFLHGLNISMQLRVLEGEKRIAIPKRFRVPAYTALMWYTVGCAIMVKSSHLCVRHIWLAHQRVCVCVCPQKARTASFVEAVRHVLGIPANDTTECGDPTSEPKRFRLKIALPTDTIGLHVASCAWLLMSELFVAQGVVCGRSRNCRCL